VSSEKQMGRSVAIFFIYVAVFLLLFAAAVRGGEPKQKKTAAATKTDAGLSQELVRWCRSSLAGALHHQESPSPRRLLTDLELTN
jgi:hypothetical protein